MRALDETETRTMFTKLASYTGASLSNLIAPPAEGTAVTERMVFRLVKDRVFYLPERIANFATSIPRDSLLTAGTMIGKFTKTGKFRLNMSSLSIIAPHARVKCWVKSNGEMPILYGSNVLKAHVARWSEDAPEHSGCVIFNQNDTPLGFGVTARSTAEMRKLEPTAVVVFAQADVGMYLRDEDTMFTT
ncbi:60S ribosome subunit biogenesis protein NIP7 [Penicillium manginii]|uniref:60S ribosome subunit biogenesis protein NIP7 n=1 Tax=Penicillium cosmopolitanum TaxID=1131564 RepID=A0A9W9VSK2_9EURO|nr:60S ribosome subunit biogenesis protein NIP7 [Penicillium cosmopolitanum]XP_056962413.1 60S ribosome subunit biogenesis protein NIP7 [Penicillium manginii]XP_057122172.1 60S ribosome subunit biogenesis protein NIP7 [Penicillium waksmanii]KAJ5388632.1 60S ribosome subunit biogenesis protein NIP7 [Penicillium cosmopolitanum]KAJ5756590.1 60S ribosome subunit biogenesis protein NIP7 [Penicillium manginii]KAJ5983134.1 60S ribosome subunit biogenesis protein NIP7 [Penicillium waksmanii]